MNRKLISGAIFTVMAAMLLASTAPTALAATEAGVTREHRNEFFIVSEVNPKRHQLILEMPTQITMVMHLNKKTVFENRQGHRLPLTDIRAGDTVYVTYLREDGSSTALTIRRGPMTVAILHTRYWNG
jgi:hypothetical protein